MGAQLLRKSVLEILDVYVACGFLLPQLDYLVSHYCGGAAVGTAQAQTLPLTRIWFLRSPHTWCVHCKRRIVCGQRVSVFSRQHTLRLTFSFKLTLHEGSIHYSGFLECAYDMRPGATYVLLRACAMYEGMFVYRLSADANIHAQKL